MIPFLGINCNQQRPDCTLGALRKSALPLFLVTIITGYIWEIGRHRSNTVIPFLGTKQKLCLGIWDVVEAHKYSDPIRGNKQY